MGGGGIHLFEDLPLNCIKYIWCIWFGLVEVNLLCTPNLSKKPKYFHLSLKRIKCGTNRTPNYRWLIKQNVVDVNILISLPLVPRMWFQFGCGFLVLEWDLWYPWTCGQHSTGFGPCQNAVMKEPPLRGWSGECSGGLRSQKRSTAGGYWTQDRADILGGTSGSIRRMGIPTSIIVEWRGGVLCFFLTMDILLCCVGRIVTMMVNPISNTKKKKKHKWAHSRSGSSPF